MQAAKDNVRAPQPGTASPSLSRAERVSRWLGASARSTLLMPTVLIILFLSIFPLIVSVYLSVARFSFVPGGFDIRFIGLKNYEKLLLGSDQRYFLGKLSELGPLEWLLLAVFVAFMAYMWFRYVTSPRFRLFGALMRIV